MSITLKVGGVYRTHMNTRVEILRPSNPGTWMGSDGIVRTDAGSAYHPGSMGHNIVAEWTEEPCNACESNTQGKFPLDEHTCAEPKAEQDFLGEISQLRMERDVAREAERKLTAERDAIQQELERVSSKADENARTYFAEGRRFASALKERDALRAELEALKPKPRTGTVWVLVYKVPGEDRQLALVYMSEEEAHMHAPRYAPMYLGPHTWTEGEFTDGGEK